MLLWKHNMHIEYLAAASWPLDSSKRSTRVEVTMEGSYDILHDISCTQRKPITSPYRTSVIRRFWNTLQRYGRGDNGSFFNYRVKNDCVALRAANYQLTAAAVFPSPPEWLES